MKGLSSIFVVWVDDRRSGMRSYRWFATDETARKYLIEISNENKSGGISTYDFPKSKIAMVNFLNEMTVPEITVRN